MLKKILICLMIFQITFSMNKVNYQNKNDNTKTIISNDKKLLITFDSDKNEFTISKATSENEFKFFKTIKINYKPIELDSFTHNNYYTDTLYLFGIGIIKISSNNKKIIAIPNGYIDNGTRIIFLDADNIQEDDPDYELISPRYKYQIFLYDLNNDTKFFINYYDKISNIDFSNDNNDILIYKDNELIKQLSISKLKGSYGIY